MYTISWHRENRVLHMKMEGEVGNEELQKMEAEAFELIQNAPGIVHAIVDLRLLSNPNSMGSSMGGMSRNKHPNQGMSIIVVSSMNRISKFVVSTMMQVLRLQFRICESMEEAEAIIDKVDVRVAQS
jgi:hypothetical protein